MNASEQQVESTRPTPAAVRLTRLWRFGAVSVMNVAITQLLLLGSYGLTSLGAVGANVFAVGVSSIPAYLVNRRWVWQRRGNHSVTREIIPFWAYTFAGLALSTAAVAAVERRWDSAAAVSAANITAFGVLWLTKFFLLDSWLFVPRTDSDELGDDRLR
ncbi:MAG: GtrA family protein [Actinomycetota bacterium]|nr:GtrA family protein [Actinomycetota bacterium]